jgi:hypothetical protein
MFVCCECCVLSGRGLCDELITRPEESYRLWCVVVCDLENLVNEEAMAHWGAVASKTKNPHCDIIIGSFFVHLTPTSIIRTFLSHLTPFYVTTLASDNEYKSWGYSATLSLLVTFSITTPPRYSYKFADFHGRRYVNDLGFFHAVQCNLFVALV